MDNKQEQLNKFTEDIGKQVQAGKKPSFVSKHMKNFFFSALQARKEVKEVSKELGKLDSVTIIISKEKNILRAQSGDKHKDSPFTEDEIKKLLKNMNVKQATVDACKTIFVMLNFKTQVISIQQNLHNGEQKNLFI